MSDERRRAKRVAISAHTIYRTEKAVEGEGNSLNVSRSGIQIKTDLLPPSGTDLVLYFKVADRQFLAPGEVVWTEGDRAGIVFRQEPHRLENFLDSLPQTEQRAANRVQAEMLVRIRRGDYRSEIVEPVNVSQGGFGFQSVLEYSQGEMVFTTLDYRPGKAETAEVPSAIVRVTPLFRWDAYSYGVRFLRNQPVD